MTNFIENDADAVKAAIAELMDNDWLLVQAQVNATKARRDAKEAKPSMIAFIEMRWSTFARRTDQAAREGRGANHNSPLDWQRKAKQMLIAREALAEMSGYVGMSLADAARIGDQHRRDGEAARYQRDLSHAVNAFPTSKVSEAEVLLKMLRGRGVSLVASEDGGIVVSPAGSLSPMEREVIKRRKAEILALLNSMERVA